MGGQRVPGVFHSLNVCLSSPRCFTILTPGNYPDKCEPGLVIAASIVLTLCGVAEGSWADK